MKIFPNLFEGWLKLNDRLPSVPRGKSVEDEGSFGVVDANKEAQVSFWMAEVKATEKARTQNLPAFYRFALRLREATEGKRLDQELRQELHVALADSAAEQNEYLAHLDPDVLEMEAQERREREILRLEQDRAYMESLRMDQAKEIHAPEILDDRPTAPLIQSSAETIVPPPERPITNTMESFSEQPLAGEGVTKLTFRFPDGTRVSRRFYKHSSLQCARDFVEHSRVSLNASGAVRELFSPVYTMLVLGAPPQPLNDLSLTLEESGLSRPALISIDAK